MKLSVTEEFLRDVYNILVAIGDASAFIFNPSVAKYVIGVENPIFKKYKNNKRKIAFSNLLYYAKTNGYIRVKNLEGKKAIMLTKEGVNKALKASFMAEVKKKRKDGKWAMLIFDVPEKQRESRDLLRSVLHNLGYKMFQQSVWITPYDVSEKTEKLLQIYSLEEYVKIFLIEEM